MLTPDQLKEHSFSLIENGCYSAEEVNRYFGEVIASYNQMYRENGELIRKISILANKVQDYRRDEDNIRNALLNAQRSSERILADAKKQADDIIAGANRQMRDIVDGREGIVTHAKEEAERLLSEARVNAENIVADAMQQSEEIQFTAKAAASESQTNAQNAAEKILADANQEAMEILTYTKQDAQSVLTDAQQQAQQLLQQAQQQAEQLVQKAQEQANQLMQHVQQNGQMEIDTVQKEAASLHATAGNFASVPEEDNTPDTAPVPSVFSSKEEPEVVAKEPSVEPEPVEMVKETDSGADWFLPDEKDTDSAVDPRAAVLDVQPENADEESDFDSFDDFSSESGTGSSAFEDLPASAADAAAADTENLVGETEMANNEPAGQPDEDESVSSFVVHVNTDDFGEYDESDNFDDFGEAAFEADIPSAVEQTAAEEPLQQADTITDDFSADFADQPAENGDDGFTIDFSLFEDDSEERQQRIETQEPQREDEQQFIEKEGKKKSRRHRKKK